MATCAISAKKLAQHAIKRPFWAILPALGEYFRAIAIDSRRWANFVAPILLTAPRDETVDTNAGAGMKPTTPLRAKIAPKTGVSGLQRC